MKKSKIYFNWPKVHPTSKWLYGNLIIVFLYLFKGIENLPPLQYPVHATDGGGGSNWLTQKLEMTFQ